MGTNGSTYITEPITLSHWRRFHSEGTNGGTVEVDAVTLDPDPCLVTNFYYFKIRAERVHELNVRTASQLPGVAAGK